MAPKKKGYKPVTFYLPAKTFKLLQLVCVSKDRYQDDICREVVSDFIEDQIVEGVIVDPNDRTPQDTNDLAEVKELSPADRERYKTYENKIRVERAVGKMSDKERIQYLKDKGVTDNDLEDMEDIEVEMTVKQLYALPSSTSTGGRRRSAVARLKPALRKNKPVTKEAKSGKPKSGTRKSS